jgi:(p)ppGpp synthase/HD superfamily hydrolase
MGAGQIGAVEAGPPGLAKLPASVNLQAGAVVNAMEERRMKTKSGSGDAATRARAFAIQAHGKQKYGSQPYAVHLDDVARTAAELGFTSAEHQAAAFLHDVLEDTATQPAEIEQCFGRIVRIAVEQLTRRKGQPESDYFAHMNAFAFAVKLSDRISNVRAIGVSDVKDPARLLKKYEGEFAQFVNPDLPYGELCKKAEHHLGHALRDAAERLRMSPPSDKSCG